MIRDGGERAINFRTIFNFVCLFFSSVFLSFPFWLSFSTFTPLIVWVSVDQIWWWWWCYCCCCQFLWRFCCICSLNSCAFVPSCLLFCSLSRPCDPKMNLCNVYLLYQHLYIFSTCIHTHKSVGIIGTWQVGGEFLFDLFLRNIHFKKLMCVFMLLLLLFFWCTFL